MAPTARTRPRRRSSPEPGLRCPRAETITRWRTDLDVGLATSVYPTTLTVDSLGHVQINSSATTAAAHRTAIGADDASNLSSGTVPAARLDTGTSANQLVQLDGSARLPAVDGSQLTNLPSSGGGNAWGGGNPDATTVKYFDDVLYTGPQDLENGNNGVFLRTGSSGVSYASTVKAGAMGPVLCQINGEYDRANWWGPTLFETSDLADGHELLIEARGRIENDDGAEDLMTTFTVGFMQWSSAFGENQAPPNTFYYAGKHACMRSANPYSTDSAAYSNVIGFVKDSSAAGGSTVDSTTITNASVLNNWVRLAVKMVYDNSNSRWDITGYVDGTLRWNDSRTLTQDSDTALIPVISLSGGGRGGTGDMPTYLDWVSLQFKRPSATSYLSI